MQTAALAGLEKIAEGREAEVFAYGDGRVLRLYRQDYRDAPAAAERQVTVLRAAAAHGVRVPEVFGTTTVEGRAGIVMERLNGRDAFETIAAQPFRLWSLSRLCARLQAQLNEQTAPSELPDLRASLRRAIDRDEVPKRFRTAALSRLETIPDDDCLIHGDFHPGNVMLLADGEAVIIDWTGARRGVPEADFARTMLMIRLGEPAPGMPTLIRFFARFARSVMLRSYEGAYRKARRIDEKLLRACELPVAVARLSENIPAEVPKLHKHIERLLARDA
ncbi:MAG TPA: aminoglycoside 3'-phosphotransferase/choline kinase family protein [Dehalococcoidia bacterium]|nr:aminoglycoside 3'-phosphotransferase/choline kinase family protein [Dehalococcoidia bacterium]